MESRGCIFCQIASGEAPSDIVHQDAEIVAFRDIHPRAPTHILVIPREHITGVAEASEEQVALLGRLLLRAADIARQEGLGQRGYRLVINSGPDSGQMVPHLHLHILGGRRLGAMG